MKLNKIIIASAVASVLALGSTSCSDSFLDEKMYSNYGTNVSDVNAKVLGLHYQIGQLLGISWPQGFWGIWQDGTDVGAPGDTEGSEVPFYKYGELNSENLGVRLYWERLYSIINGANQIISANGENASATACVAEAKFFRAYCYNKLVTGWGAVPLIIESASEPKTDYTRTPVTEVDAQIEKDITEAIAGLPEVNALTKESRISKDAARLVAAEAFLRMGMRDNSYYKKAEDAITPTITSGNYKLISERYGKFTGEAGDYYHDMFRWGNQRRSQGNTEGIWTYEQEYNTSVSGGIQQMKSADETAAIMMEALLKDLDVKAGEKLLVVINGSGATTLMEQLIVFRACHKLLAEKGIEVVASMVGEILTVQETAGFQLFIARMDDELLGYWMLLAVLLT